MDELIEKWTNKVFSQGRTFKSWSDRLVSDTQIKQIYELMRWAPTAMNCSPARMLFLTSAHAKERLRHALHEGNVPKTMTAPVTALIGYDENFYEQLPKLYPGGSYAHLCAKSREEKSELGQYNCILQAAYLIIASRAIGLDCGPISGFDEAAVNAEFFNASWPCTENGGKVKITLICNLGYGNIGALRERNSRLEFEEACMII